MKERIESHGKGISYTETMVYIPENPEDVHDFFKESAKFIEFVELLREHCRVVLDRAGLPSKSGNYHLPTEQSKPPVFVTEEVKHKCMKEGHFHGVTRLQSVVQRQGYDYGDKVHYAARIVDHIDRHIDNWIRLIELNADVDRDSALCKMFELGALSRQANIAVRYGPTVDAAAKTREGARRARQSANASAAPARRRRDADMRKQAYDIRQSNPTLSKAAIARVLKKRNPDYPGEKQIIRILNNC